VAPLSNLNVQATGNLSKYCEIKHVPTSYTETTIIDGKHMFQFKNPSAEHKDLEKTALFENTFYTNEPKCVEKTESWFREIWKKAEVPSTFTADSVHTTMPSLTVSEKSFLAPFNMLRKMSYVTLTEDDYSATLTERDVLDKVIASHKNPTLKGALKYHGYASSGLAVIRLHDQLRLPNVLIRAWHFDKQSIFGEGDLLMIHLWLESPKGYAFVPVAIVHEQPEMTTSWKEWMAGTPAAQNVQLVRKDQIQVQTYGKTMLAGWTNTIPLATKSYTLPPSTITLEGYGTVVTGALTQVFPSGVRSRMEFNGFEAFVTFIHGTTKYSGPSTEGFVFRETLLGDPKSGFYKRAQL